MTQSILTWPLWVGLGCFLELYIMGWIRYVGDFSSYGGWVRLNNTQTQPLHTPTNSNKKDVFFCINVYIYIYIYILDVGI